MRPVPERPGLPAPRAMPPAPYRQSPRHLRLPVTLPQAVSAELADSAAAGLEAAALLYGTRALEPDDADIVSTLVIPEQDGQSTHYRIPAESITAASAATRPLNLVTLGQVHCHPGEDVEHSWYDDRHAISIRALSFVLPQYGRGVCDWLTHAGVHDWQDNWWHLLTAEQAQRRVSFTDTPLQIIDLRITERQLT